MVSHQQGPAMDNRDHGRAIWTCAEAMREHAGLPPKYWPYSVAAYVYVHNLLPSSKPNNIDLSPYELW